MKKILTKLLRKFFPELKFSHTSYSQDGEDMVLKAFFETRDNYQGFYVDIGAHHPFRFSNTAYFYEKGWSGINIEPTPDLIAHFQKHRPRDINLNVGISNTPSQLTFYIFDEPALNSFDEQLSNFRDTTTQYNIVERIAIQTHRLSDIFDEYLPKDKQIDFLTIDVEGLDFEVLKSNDWNKYIPTFILVEQGFDVAKIGEDEIYRYLTGLQYELVGRTMRTSVFRLRQHA